ncbi:tyrosine-type recombinase/integrase [Burkholderiales bacterium]|nr:tyrosine-type recombinase/integrase [Burkholderiales bacterium]
MAYSISTIQRSSKPGHYPVGNNLYVHVKNQTQKYWYFRFKDSGRQRVLHLGSLKKVSKEKAKSIANKIHVELDEKREQLKLVSSAKLLGIVSETKYQQTQVLPDDASPLYKDAIVSFMEIKSADLGEKKQLSWVNGLNTFLPKFGKKRMSSITTDIIVTELKKTWTKTTVGTKAKLDMLSRLFSWAIANGHHPGPNPAAWKENIEFKLPNPSKIHKVKNHPSLPYSQAPFFYAELSQLGTLGSKALQLLVLTGQRSGQIRTAKWSDIDIKKRTWSFKAENMKMSIPHVIPICDRLMDVLNTIDKTDSDYLFSTKGKALADVSVSKVIKDINKKRVNSGRHEWVDPADNRPVNPHGFRTTLRVWGADKQHPKDAMEFQIAHKLKDKVEAAYNRSNLLEVRRDIMEQWSAHCLQSS